MEVCLESIYDEDPTDAVVDVDDFNRESTLTGLDLTTKSTNGIGAGLALDGEKQGQDLIGLQDKDGSLNNLWWNLPQRDDL